MAIKTANINGITLIYERSRMCKGVSFEIYTYGGSGIDTVPGIAHFYEHMLFNGTSKNDGEQLGSLIRKFNCRQNAMTSKSYIKGVSVNSAKNFENNFKLTAEMMFDSKFPQSKIDKERGVVEQEIFRMLDNNESICRWQAMQKIYDNKIYNEHTLGTPESLKKITRKKLLDFKKMISVRENIVVSVAGNVSFAKCKHLVKRYIAEVLPSGQNYNPHIEKIKINGKPQLVLLSKPTFKTSINVMLKTDGMENVKISYYKNVLRNVLNRIKGRMYNTFREQNSLVYACNYGRIAGQYDGLDVYSIYTSKDKINACIDALGSMLQDLRQNGITKEEWESFKSGEEVLDDTEVENYEEWPSENFSKIDLWGSGYKHRKKAYEKCKKTVTLEEVNEYIKKSILNGDIWISIVGDVTKKEVYSYKKMCEMLRYDK